MMLLCKFVIFIALCKAVYMASDTIIDNVFVDDPSVCDDGWKRFDKYCFQLNRMEKDWRTASTDCRIRGGNLASIHSKEQNDFLRDLSRETGISYWFIGLHDHALDGIFVWDDGTDIDYTNWSDGEPDGDYYSGDCVATSFHGSNLGKWYVRPCNSERSYLCQKKVSVATIVETEVDHTETETMPYIDMHYITVAPALITEMDDITITGSAMTSTGIERRTAPTEIIVTKENDNRCGFISVTNFIITLIIVIVFMVLMGGIIYYKRFYGVEENRVKV